MEFKTKTTLTSTGDIKREAKAQLQGNWRTIIFLCLIPAALGLLLGSGSFIEVIINPSGNETENISPGTNSVISFLNQFLYIGIVYTLIDYIRKRKAITPFKDVFQVFSRKYFLSDLLIYIIRSIYIFLWSLLFLIPGIIKSYAHSQSFNAYKDMTKDGTIKNVTANQAISESRKIMDGHKMELFILGLSFLGWWIISIIALGIPLFWVIPYYQMSRATFYQNLVKNYDVNEGYEISDF